MVLINYNSGSQKLTWCSPTYIIVGTREFSIGQLKGKQLSPTFQPDALVIFRDKVKGLKSLDFRPEDD